MPTHPHIKVKKLQLLKIAGVEAERIGGPLAAPSNRLSRRRLHPEVLPDTMAVSKRCTKLIVFKVNWQFQIFVHT